jgi:hypothetical protein
MRIFTRIEIFSHNTPPSAPVNQMALRSFMSTGYSIFMMPGDGVPGYYWFYTGTEQSVGYLTTMFFTKARGIS